MVDFRLRIVGKSYTNKFSGFGFSLYFAGFRIFNWSFLLVVKWFSIYKGLKYSLVFVITGFSVSGAKNYFFRRVSFNHMNNFKNYWYAREDLNLRPSDPKSDALSAGPRAQDNQVSVCINKFLEEPVGFEPTVWRFAVSRFSHLATVPVYCPMTIVKKYKTILIWQISVIIIILIAKNSHG